MSKLQNTFPALWQFFGAYLHQDWDDDYDSPESAFRDFLDGEPRSSALVAEELTTVLESGRDELALEQFVLDCGSFYAPRRHGIATSTWLAGLLAMSPGGAREES